MLLLTFLVACGDAARDTEPSGGKGGADSGEPTADSGDDTACAQTWYFDDDGDGWGLEGTSLVACAQPAGYADLAGDCDDTDAAVHPGAAESCNGADDDCDGTADQEAIDASQWYADADGDGFGAEVSGVVAACTAPPGYAASDAAEDCDDDDATVFPGADERCDATDRDCDGDPTNAPVDGSAWYLDADGDGYGDPGISTVACDEPVGWTGNDDDCDDAEGTRYPGADEYCNEVDDDCDGSTDEVPVDPATYYRDRDADGYGDSSSITTDCAVPAGYAALAGDCDDADAAVNPAAAELCGGADENCDGTTDESTAADASTWYIDDDGDGYGSAGSPLAACTVPSGYVSDDSDCDDAAPGTNPGADETCGGGDENCDGATDEATAVDAVDYYADADGDGYGDAATAAHGCLVAGAVLDDQDCDDGDSAVSPAATEVCGDAVDDDCDGSAQACFAGTYATSDADLQVSGSSSGGGFAHNAVAGDLDGDGQDDLVALATSASTLYFFGGPVTGTSASSADATFTSMSGRQAYGSPGLWADRDVTGDGTADLVVFPCTPSSGDVVCVGESPLSSTTNFYPRFSAPTYQSLSDADLGDIDGNGVAELLVIANTSVLYAYEPGDPSFYYNNVWLGTGPTVGTITGISTGGVASGGDMDGDGIDEVVLTAANWTRVWDVVTSTTTGADAVASWTHDATVPDTLVVGDVDGDGLADLLHAHASGEEAYLLTNPLDGGDIESDAVASFASSGSTSFPQRPDGDDLDGDGRVDLVFGSFDLTNGAAWLFYGPVVGAVTVESDADATIVNPSSSASSHEYNLIFPLADALGTGNRTVGYGLPAYGGAGALWLFDVG